MKKTLYLMRHGQTLFNLQHKIQGWCDSPLTELGIKQAQVAGQYFKDNNIIIDHAYSSTSERASDTLEYVTDFKIPYIRVKGLKEWNFGAFEGKDECLNPKLPYGDFFKQFGGEGELKLRERICNTLKEIMEKDDHKVVLAVSHGAACAQFYCAWEKCAKVKKTERFYNCCILKFEYENEIFTLTEIYNHDLKV
ncbi:histidine phosphatase family protein [uncultured Clostridium sp.]|uniref:histidine phosphatase family protein n=1 Tax=uncultured Clostridium sp. TaxID=59620 RepID=UPI0025D682B4|nr:histidine phosphatase family protein [uncultured Clostridium sp.]